MAKVKVDISNLDMEDLIELQSLVDDRIKEIAESEVEKLESQIEKLKPYVKRRKTTRGAPRGKVAAKYKDPATGKTWSGRGQTPVWLREYESKGRKREEFAL